MTPKFQLRLAKSLLQEIVVILHEVRHESDFSDEQIQIVGYGALVVKWLSENSSHRDFTFSSIYSDLLAVCPQIENKIVFLRELAPQQESIFDVFISHVKHHKISQIFPQVNDLIDAFDLFLGAYDANVRMEKGVFYTPVSAIKYMVESVDRTLIDVGLDEGLADRSSWGDLGLTSPDASTNLSDAQTAFVKIIDPACGTGKFLVYIIRFIHQKVKMSDWPSYVRDHLLPRIWGFELLFVPHVISMIQIALTLRETGFALTEKDSLHLYQTNALVPFPEQYFTVVIGNPPYSGHSKNTGEWISNLIAKYRSIDEVPIELSQPKWLQNDYVKFFAVAEYWLRQSRIGVLAYITDHSFLDGESYVGLRHHLLQTFSTIKVIDLHGNYNRREPTPDGEKDENIFDIRQGVSIFLGQRKSFSINLASLHIADLWGTRSHKYEALESAKISFSPLSNKVPFVWVQDSIAKAKKNAFASYDSIAEIFSVGGKPAPGFVTTHDAFAISFTRNELVKKMRSFVNTTDESHARTLFKLCSQRQWSYSAAKSFLLHGDWKKDVRRCAYRPFDDRWTVYNSNVCVHRRERVSRHFIDVDSIGLTCSRMTKGDDFRHVFATNQITEVIYLSSKTSANAFVFPLFLADGRVNIAPHVLAKYKEIAQEVEPIAILYYSYAILFSPAYRNSFNDLLIRQFPRVPLPITEVLFSQLSLLGKQLFALHLSPRPMSHGFDYSGSCLVDKGMPKWVEQQIFINRKQSFQSVAKDVWEYRIGSYQVAKKWLLARRGRKLENDEIKQFGGILNSLKKTMAVQKKIDELVLTHWNWNV